jgi:asparagine synthase (glutamine-hydrolysing)
MRRFVANAAHRTRSELHHLERLNGSRYLELSRAILAALARDAGVELRQPFLDARLFKAVMAETPTEGFPSRNAGLEAFFGDLLPRAVAKRTTKAVFTEVFWSPESRDFARQWDGTGLDHSLIDPDKLRQEWLKPAPDARSNNCIQAAWLACQGRS